MTAVDLMLAVAVLCVFLSGCCWSVCHLLDRIATALEKMAPADVRIDKDRMKPILPEIRSKS